MDFKNVLNLIITALPIIVSVAAFLSSRGVRDRVEKFEEELERKQKNWQIETMHFPKLISNFRGDMGVFEQYMNSKAGASNYFVELQNRIENSEIQFFKPIDEALKMDLEKINEGIIPKMKEHDKLKMSVYERTHDLWTIHLEDRTLYDHGNFPERDLARRVLINSIEGIINGDPSSVTRNFASELKVELSGNVTFFDPYNANTPQLLYDIAMAEYEPLRNLQREILEDLNFINEVIEKMEEIMAM